MKLNKTQFKKRVIYWLKRESGKNIQEAGSTMLYRAAAKALMDEGIWDNQLETETAVIEEKYKRACYLSAEFLMGRALGNNLINLELEKDAGEALKELGLDLNSAEEAEPDAALGNGGLGRLAACFLDSLATLDYPARGYGIRYKYGMFRQEIKNSRQVEKPDDWDAENDPWSVRRENLAVTVRFGGNVAA
jgi:starch phosphorylase